MPDENLKYNSTFENAVKGAVVGEGNIIYNYFYYREEVEPVDSAITVDKYLPCPYRGLFHFGPNDADFFFGREIFIEELYSTTRTRNFIPVLGASGSGKSSVVLAGLVPKLQKEGHWHFTHFRPGADPFHALAVALVPLYTPTLDETDQIAQARKMAGYLQDGSVTLSDVFTRIQQNHPNHRVLLIADQFEEIYTLCNNLEIRRKFLDCILASLVTPTSLPLSATVLVTTMRADFLGNALSYRPFADVLQNADLKLGPMNQEELTQVIEKPAQKLGMTFETGLVKRILNDVKNQPGNLPLLEFALTDLWNKRTGKQLTHKIYEEIGQVEGALARHADEKYGNLTDDEKEKVRRIFIQLVRPGEGIENTRRLATKVELGEASWALVTKMANARLVVTSRNSAAQETVEVVHEALIHNWGKLRLWMETDRRFRAWQERLRVAMQQWNAIGRDEGALLRGKPLTDAQEWLQNRPEELTAEQEYIKASLGLQEREKQKLSRQRKRIIVGLTGGLVGALGLAAIAGVGWWFATNAATNERIKALVSESRELFTLSGVSEYDPDRKDFTSFRDLSPTKEEQERKETDDKKKEIFFQEASLKAIRAGREMQYAIGVKTETQFQVLEALRRVIATKEEPVTLTLPECEPFKRGPSSLTWTSDGKTIACVNYDGTVRLWDGKTGKKNNVFRGDSEWVDDVQFSPDGKIIASGTADGTVKLWERKTGKEIRVLKGHLSQVRSISFSPDGQTLAAANYDGTIIVWEVGTGRELNKLSGHSDEKNPDVDWLLFSPNGQFFVSRSRRTDGTLKLWKVSTGEKIKTIRFNNIVSFPHFIFSPDSQTFIYSDGKSINQVIRFWNIANRKETRNILVPGQPFISPDGQVIAVIDYKDNSLFGKSGKLSTSYTKGTVSLWDTSAGKKVKILNNFPSGQLSKISFSPDSSLIAIYAYDNKGGSVLGSVLGSKAKITFWKRDGAKLKTIEQSGEIFQINFSPSGQKVAISSFDRRPKEGQYITFKLWDVATGKNLKTLIDESILFSLRGFSVGLESRFSPDGRMIAAVNSSGIAKFFDSSTGAELISPNVSPSHNISQRTSADEKSVITLGADGSLRYRDRATGREFKMNRYDSMLVSATRISNDKTITTVNWYGKLQQRELTTGRILRSINLPFDKSASSLKFSSDGSKVAAARSNYTVKIWDATTGKEIHTLKGYAKRANEANDWRRSELHFSPNGRIVAVVRVEDYTKDTKNSALELWEISTGKAIQFSEKISGIKGISFSPNGDELAILKTNDTVQLWKLATRQLTKTIRPTLDSIRGIQFSPESESLFAFSYKELKILNISTNREIASFKLPIETPLNPSIDFGSDRKTLILHSDNKFTFLNFDLEYLLNRNCQIIGDYLKNNSSVSKEDKHICD